MLTLKQLASVIAGPTLVNAFHRISRLIGYFVTGQITLRSFARGFLPNAVTVINTSSKLLWLDGSYDRMLACCDDSEIDTVYVGRWSMNPCTLTWSRAVVGQDALGYFYPGMETRHLGDHRENEWMLPFVSFAAARRVARSHHSDWQRKVSPFVLV